MRRFILIILITELLLRSGESNETNDGPLGTMVQGRSKWYDMHDLEAVARKYVQKMDARFDPKKTIVTIWVYDATKRKKQPLVLVSYGTWFAEPFGNVYIGRDGLVVRFETGLASEGEQTIPEQKQTVPLPNKKPKG